MIALGSDHGGYGLKQEIIRYLEEKGIEYKDYGCYDERPCDYPVYGKKAAQAVASGECEKGILICGTGIGISIAANKVKGIRAALCHDVFSAKATSPSGRSGTGTDDRGYILEYGVFACRASSEPH